MALSWLWIIAVALAGVYFVYSATVEERYLTEQFPDTYPPYRHSTKCSSLSSSERTIRRCHLSGSVAVVTTTRSPAS